MHADTEVHAHFNSIEQTGKTRRIACMHCVSFRHHRFLPYHRFTLLYDISRVLILQVKDWTHAKHTTAQRRHLLICEKYHDWAAANNQPLVTETSSSRPGRPSTSFDDWSATAGASLGSLRLPNTLRPDSGGGDGEAESIDADADPEEERTPISPNVKRQIDAHLARGIFRGGHEFTIFENNPEFRTMFQLLGYNPPGKDIIRTRLLDDYYKSLKTKS